MTESRDVQVVIREMLDHIDYVLDKTRDLSRYYFQTDREIRQSVERSPEMISEASRLLPSRARNSLA